MILNKITTVEATTTDGKRMVEGTDYVIILSDRSLCGTYRGITKKSALMFEVPVKGENIRFNIMPNSVKKIFEATIEVKQEYMNAPEQEESTHDN
ncbi:hypothetical protein C3B58_15405 [Lactonifactor longoviformis]|uniref:Uncharacterized protein n=1 Tax=Lactonifactor longoviformis DSM 17459 TaxID=1122155 RepID=A0A1M5DEX9_9CLOT|nr:hypothetical protein [Lactonifactor longoviformis]POP31681.1 hypothetical protein C3B58_15405 [Lactonifactor longoviformis]SHF65232.1 hypothetical protein SAMN02745158_04510 [Lactonifactor longoviformis DSM 17459]